jgi:hypothetical protein
MGAKFQRVFRLSTQNLRIFIEANLGKQSKRFHASIQSMGHLGIQRITRVILGLFNHAV